MPSFWGFVFLKASEDFTMGSRLPTVIIISPKAGTHISPHTTDVKGIEKGLNPNGTGLSKSPVNLRPPTNQLINRVFSHYLFFSNLTCQAIQQVTGAEA